MVLIGTLSLNLGLLFYFKYFNLFIHTVEHLRGMESGGMGGPYLGIGFIKNADIIVMSAVERFDNDFYDKLDVLKKCLTEESVTENVSE